MTLELDNNQLTTIPAYVFKNLSAVNPTSIYLYLDNNHISNIEMHAFGGVENLITELSMENNNITHLPRALTELSSLHLLDILRNPLVKLDASVLANFGSSLEYLFIPVDRLSTLSNELHFLTVLSQLTMHGISSPKLDSTVFQGFENSLTSLDMSYAYFERIPTAVCTLKSLKSFTSNHSPNLGTYNSSIFGECNHTMTSVTSLSLQYDQLATIPKLGRIFPRLDILRLQNNVLHFIENSSLIGMTSLTELNLGNNN